MAAVELRSKRSRGVHCLCDHVAATRGSFHALDGRDCTRQNRSNVCPEIKLADLVWTNGVPSLANTQTYEPVKGTLYEPYSFSADDSRFTSLGKRHPFLALP